MKAAATPSIERPTIGRRMSPIILAGPTASGKSDIALEMASRVGAEIVAADSMQVYRSLDILSAKPTRAERGRVPHHCIDIADAGEEFTVARWLESARAAIASIQTRDLLPLVVGGTGLYIRALRLGLDPNPPTPPHLRAALASRPTANLVAELRQLDPAAADRIDLKNRRRVERALAIALQGAPNNRASWAGTPGTFTLLILRREAEDLRERIATRVDAMFEAGVVAEVRFLLDSGLAKSPSSQALGFAQIQDMLAGRCTEREARDRLVTATRQFAKRQMTWFRREKDAIWIDVRADEPAATTAARLMPHIR